MKRLIGSLLILGFILASCGGAKLDVAVEEAPKYKADESFPIVMSISENNEPVTDLEVVAILEMARMDHGTIEVTFADEGDGTYSSEVELPMAGEWIMNMELTQEGNTSEEIVTFDVEEE